MAADPFVQRMHEASGLWGACAQEPDAPGCSTLEAADEFLRSICEGLVGHGKPTGIVLAGATVHFDLGFVRVHMPRFAKCLSHRVFDVSTLKNAERSWGSPELVPFALPEGIEHRALPDILNSIREASILRARRWAEVAGQRGAL